MFTLGFLCLFLGFIIAIMGLMALASRDARGDDNGPDNERDNRPDDHRN